MAARETIVDRAANVWTQQMDRWIESVNLCQNQYQRMMSLWMGQAVEAQKEGQKFWQEWMDCWNKGQTDLMKAWQASLKEATQLFRFESPEKSGS